MEKVDFKQAKEQGSLWDSQSAMDSGKLRALTNLCERAKELSRDCGSYGDYPASASLLCAVCLLFGSLRLSRSNTLRSACEIEAELKADNGGVPLRTLISWSGACLGFAKTALVRKRYEFSPVRTVPAGCVVSRVFATFCSDYNAGFSTLLAVA